MTRQEAKALIEAIKLMRDNTTDEVAVQCMPLFPTVKYDSALVSVGTRISFNGKLYKAAVDLWDTENNNPENAPTLWAELTFSGGDNIRDIPEVITVTTAFSYGELGRWNGKIYKSLADANVYTPDQYPPYWELQE